MDKHEEIVAEVKNLVAAPSVYGGLKELAQKWLDAEGTAAQANLTALLHAALKEDVNTIDAVIPFFASEAAKKRSALTKLPKCWPRPRKSRQAAANTASARPAPPEPNCWNCWPKGSPGKVIPSLAFFCPNQG